MAPVTSPQNPTIKLIRSLSEKKFRQETGLFVAEGWEMLDRARKAGWVPEHLVSTGPISAWGETRPILVTEKIMEGLSGQNNPHSALATFKQHYETDVDPKGVWVALEDMRDPGNLGTIIRTADAVAASGVILVGQSCDPYSGDCVRATTGSIFGIPLVRMETDSFIALGKSWRGDVVGTHLKGNEDFRRTYRSPTLLVMGSERRGLSEELAAACSGLVRIPMPGGAESLNVATATALMLYEAVKP
ncbi:MAG TPA: RNA methyltransferase [Aestuariivirga sp.]|nr:RNA methyltransferase [Aestuariivirga sp.]